MDLVGCACVDILAIIQTQQVGCGISPQISFVQLIEWEHGGVANDGTQNGGRISAGADGEGP
jgi:hypothetical protein